MHSGDNLNLFASAALTKFLLILLNPLSAQIDVVFLPVAPDLEIVPLFLQSGTPFAQLLSFLFSSLLFSSLLCSSLLSSSLLFSSLLFSSLLFSSLLFSLLSSSLLSSALLFSPVLSSSLL